MHFFSASWWRVWLPAGILQDAPAFQEGELPRRLWRIIVTKPGAAG
ncbi:hypothetical protein [Mycobacterium pseudokansasii]|uniref:Uncharacterized protein n=1 Tax=Mycobacterium pseudokansasii TaxID=2341080 RepID=A0A498QJB5_9MYCO|nr:hypothetical protein [Mycobacterium pseudokansasii]MBY0389969.1 hypothetical protein [Mycobacterium pseudokansasii]VAZ88601.1 hypothetical protein LAUMK35_00600 [Mycobacterium pseudokansasii]VAZ89072.1 hypothetical protein LAUMK21_00601 [Mycobacterium pseudokansasii]VBA46781.1 hypothetical protein LAUMK142_00476 [Mycobacterium pseudokansasii]